MTSHQDPAALARQVLKYHSSDEEVGLAHAVLALTEERDRMRALLAEARDVLVPLSEYELPIMLLNRIDLALRGKETT